MKNLDQIHSNSPILSGGVYWGIFLEHHGCAYLDPNFIRVSHGTTAHRLLAIPEKENLTTRANEPAAIA